MRIITGGTENTTVEARASGMPPLPHEHPGPGPHIPPHLRKAMTQVEFGEDDWKKLQAVFGNEDTAAAAADIIRKAPLEIQILAMQLLNQIKEVA